MGDGAMGDGGFNPPSFFVCRPAAQSRRRPPRRGIRRYRRRHGGRHQAELHQAELHQAGAALTRSAILCKLPIAGLHKTGTWRRTCAERESTWGFWRSIWTASTIDKSW